MGSGNSTLHDLPNNAYLKRFVSTEVITSNDPFWNQLLSFSMKLKNTVADNRLLEESVEPLFKTLLNNSSTGNLSSLLQVFLSRSRELKASAQLENRVFTWQTFNALFVLRCIIKLLLQVLSEDEAIAVLQTIPSGKAGKPKEDNSILVEQFATSLVEIIVDVPLSNITYDLHVEATSTLIVLISSHIFAIGTCPRHLILRMLLSGKPTIHAYLLVKILLKRIMSRDLPPSRDEGGSIILGIASGLWNVLTLGMSSEEEEKKEETELPRLASQSLLLLLILVNHCTSEKLIHNPYRTALLSAQNFQDPAENSQSQAVATFKIEYPTLYSTLCSYIPVDQVTLLVYVLLHKNSDFRTYVLSRTDIETLVVPILKTLYNATDSTSHHIYMSLIIILILSEDDSFNKTIHDIFLNDISWYTERPISHISLGGLLILVVIRTITFNMNKMRDKYLHTNCLAALANMSSQFRSLHPYVCQRIVNLFETLARKHTKLSEALKQSENLIDGSETDISDVLSDISVLEEVLRMVLEILNSTLTHQLAHNHNLIYTLLYNKHHFQLFSSHPNFEDVTQNIEVILNYLMTKLETKTSDPTVKDVQEIIKEGVLHLPRERLKKFPELRFKYVEENEPEDFFIPYVWTLVYHCSGLYWNVKKITLFDPHPSDR
ncbi:UNVERIFIED_CONTAM: hypothetical protein RMT77_002150 [Armadillidium vulgare]